MQKGRKFMKKTLKTKIAACVLAASSLVSSAAFAADINSIYSKTDNSVDIIYNGEALTYTDVQPQIINDRVMIPFRTVLETMGAQVNYDEASRIVKAVRGGTAIEFSLDGTTIDIDKNGEKSQLTMDVPMAVVNDRTLVPIRFMSNAFGMNVGWENGLKTVVILDSEAYINELNSLTNISKLMKLESKMPAKDTGAFSISIDFSGTGMLSDTAFDAAIDVKYDVNCIDGVVDGNAAVNLDIDGLNKMLKELSGSGVELKNIENAVVNVVADDGVLYFKTDLIEKLAAAYPNASELSAVAKFADKNTWFKWDITKMLEESAKEMPSMQPIADLFKGGITGMNNMKGEDAFKLILSREGDVSLYEVIAMEGVMETYKIMDKYITIDVAENGDYTMKMDMPKDMLAEVMSHMGLDSSDPEAKKIMDAIEFAVKADASQKDGKITSKVDYVIGFDYAEGNEGIKFSLKFNAESNGELNAAEGAVAAKVPGAAIDVMDIMDMLQ